MGRDSRPAAPVARGNATPLQVIYSATKSAVAGCATCWSQQGRLDLHAPVARYWPESAAGKAEIPVRWLLSHQAGLPVIDRSLSVADVLAGRRGLEPGGLSALTGLRSSMAIRNAVCR